MKESAQEAADCIAVGGGSYFRQFGYLRDGKLVGWPKNLDLGDRVWYVEDSYVRGYAIVDDIMLTSSPRICDTTGKSYPAGCYVQMRADSWKWVKPVKYKGFRGWRYHNQSSKVIGNWLDSKPVVEISV